MMSSSEILPWAIALLALVGAVVAILWRPRRRSTRHRPLPTEWNLAPRPVFSTDERRVYRQLREALPHHIILSKLPLVRFCQPLDPQQRRYWFETLGTGHVTFAVCSINGRVLAAVDLDTERGHSQRMLLIKQSVMAACRIRYLRCPVDHMPSVAELQLLVPQAGAMRGPQAAPVPERSTLRDPLTPSRAAPRRAPRHPLWQDSSFLQDSFFSPDSRQDQPTSGYSTYGSGAGALPESPEAPPRPRSSSAVPDELRRILDSDDDDLVPPSRA